jgi:hypothetical protein
MQQVSPERTAIPSILFTPRGELRYDIAYGNPVNGSFELLFSRALQPNRQFRYLNRETLQEGTRSGLIATRPVEYFPERGKLMIYVREGVEGDWQLLGEIDKPTDNPVYRRFYRMTLDSEGILRLHAGEVPFWETTDRQMLAHTEGCVYRHQLEQKSREPDMERDPFTGRH